MDAIERHRSLLKASATPGVSQPALTNSLHELEDILQLRLFDRHSRGVRPTEMGMVFVRSARRILAAVLPGALARLKAAHLRSGCGRSKGAWKSCCRCLRPASST